MAHDRDDVDESTGTKTPGLRYDDWPVRGYDEDERAVAYLGATGEATGPGTETAILYDERAHSIFEADIDEDERRFVPEPDTERELTPSETLSEVLTDLGDRLDSDSLSAFAREHLEAADDEDRAVAEPEESTFTRSNVASDADHDLEFTGSHTFRRADGRVRVVRTFDVTLAGPDEPDAATAYVTDRVLDASGSNETGVDDAEVLDERTTTFGIDLDVADTDRRVAALVEDRCRAWHESTVRPPE